MNAKILDGKALSNKIKARLSEQIKLLPDQPGLDVILVGSNPASEIYVHHKTKACEQVGIRSRLHKLAADCTQTQIEALINACNRDTSVHGILLQLPLPTHLCCDDLLEKIDPHKDVDGFHPYNLGRLVQRRPALRPCTPHGIMNLLAATGEPLAGKHAVIIGASNIVGRPMALELLLAKCTITICHRFTQDLSHYIKQADILVVAIGKPGVIKSEWIKTGAIVIDVGISRLENSTLVGDIDFATAKQKASWITPVPGGVGPMTVATLLENTFKAYKKGE